MSMLCTVCKISESRVNLSLPEDSCQNSLGCYAVCRTNSTIYLVLSSSVLYPRHRNLLKLLNRQASGATSIVSLSRPYVRAIYERWSCSWRFPSFTCGTHLLSLMQRPGRFRPLFQTRGCEDYFSLPRSGNMENGWGSCAVLFLILLKLSP